MEWALIYNMRECLKVDILTNSCFDIDYIRNESK